MTDVIFGYSFYSLEMAYTFSIELDFFGERVRQINLDPGLISENSLKPQIPYILTEWTKTEHSILVGLKVKKA
jgi:hypothetical protein